MPDRNSSVPTPRRSPRFLPQQNHDTPDPKSSKRSVSAEKSKNCAVGPKRSAGLNSLRRSPRLNNEPGDKKLKGTRVKGGEAETKSNRIVSVVEGSGGGRRRRNERNRKRVKVETQENRVVSDEGGAKKRGNGKRVEVKTDDNHVVLDEGLGGGRNKRGNSKKRKRGSEEIGKGWTKEQESALQKAYLTVKPTPHFWKNISKMVPGKSKQDCFDRIHSDYPTPPQTQTQTRSRAKTWNSSPIHQFSISPSNLLKPTDKTVRRRPTVLKPKNIITQKFVEKQLQRHLEVDLDCDGVDLFSVLEPNVDFPISKALPTPKRQKKKQRYHGRLDRC